MSVNSTEYLHNSDQVLRHLEYRNKYQADISSDETDSRLQSITNLTETISNGETVAATFGNSLVKAGGGDDTITEESGNDFIGAGEGDDTVSAGNGNDIIYAGSGDDSIKGW